MKKKIVFITTSIFLGFFAVILLKSQDISGAKPTETTEDLALEASVLFKTNNEYRENLTKLDQKYKDYLDKNNSQNLVAEDILKYKKLLGLEKIEGPGVEIKIENNLSVSQIIDLFNNLKNIGVDGISINTNRVVFNKGWSGENTLIFDKKEIKPPFDILAVGNKDLLFEALTRQGGVSDEFKKAGLKVEVVKKDKILLEKNN